ncbi:protein fantom-like [Petromyzon marinus]|uniref:protein fantom-like n=1 Tax=Petromyzon marinus TaxID=7757 RepID=UPI003F6EA9E4
MADETAYDLPVRDIGLSASDGAPITTTQPGWDVRERQAVSRVSRAELEDRFLRQHEEHRLLKQHARSQEDKIKRMATKLMRLLSDRKNHEGTADLANVAGGGAGVRPRSGRDIEMEEMLEDSQAKVRELERHNEGLRQRLSAARQQLLAQGRRASPFGRVAPRVDSGLRRTEGRLPLDEKLRGGMRLQEPDVAVRATQTGLPRYGHSLLEEARAEIRNLENVVETQQAELREALQAHGGLQAQLRAREAEVGEATLRLREQQSSGQRSSIRESVGLIRLQKELADKGVALAAIEGKFVELQEAWHHQHRTTGTGAALPALHYWHHRHSRRVRDP